MSRHQGPTSPVFNQEGLASLVQEVIQRRFKGSRRRAACAVLGVAFPPPKGREMDVAAVQRQLGRVINKKANRISATSEARLKKLVPEDRWRELHHLVHDPLKAIPFAYGGEWTERRLEELLHADDHTLPSEVEETILAQEIVWTAIREAFPTVVKPIYDLLEKGHTHRRLQLAIWRIVDPLLDGMRTEGQEKTLRDWDRSHLKAYVKAAVEKEVRLLDRDPDPSRFDTGRSYRWADSERMALMVLVSYWRENNGSISTKEAVNRGFLPFWIHYGANGHARKPKKCAPRR